MLMQQSNLQNFITNYLSDVIDWRKHVLPATDPSLKEKIEREYMRETTGDQAHVIVSTEYNRYYMSAASMYVEPPHGAPIECKMLGTIVFEELTAENPVRMVRPRADQTFIDIARQVRKSELKGCIKDVRRQLAECADDENRKILLARLPTLMSKAKEFGVDLAGLPIPMIESLKEMPAISAGESIRQIQDVKESFKRAEAESSHVVNTPVASELFVGAPVIYITNPGEAVGGQREIPGIVNKIIAGDMISGVFFPDHSEVMHKDRLYRRTANTVRSNCWDFSPGYAELVAKQKALEARLFAMEERTVETAVQTGIDALAKRITELDQATKAVVDTELKPLRERIEVLTNTVLELQTRPEPTRKAKS